jgi:hypothetical protein
MGNSNVFTEEEIAFHLKNYKDAEQWFSLNENQIYHGTMYFKELESIVNLAKDNVEYLFSAIEIRRRLYDVINDWKESAIEDNLYFLNKAKVILLECVGEVPVRKYRITVNDKNFEAFAKRCKTTFRLDFDYTESQFYSLLDEVEKESFNNWNSDLTNQWETKFLNFYNLDEVKCKLIEERDKFKKHYDDRAKNYLYFYNVHNKVDLAKKLAEASRYEELPLDRVETLHEKNPLDHLKTALHKRFSNLIQIKVLNELIEKYSQPVEQKNKLPPPTPTGYYINLTDEQLTLTELYHKLVDATFLKPTNVGHFVNAFNGMELADGFKPIEWHNPTFGAIFIEYVTRKSNPWKTLKPLMSEANYSKLLNQSKNSDTYNTTIEKIKILMDS